MRQASTRPGSVPAHRGPSSSDHKPKQSLRPTSRAWTQPYFSGSTSSLSSNTRHARCTSVGSPPADQTLDQPSCPQPHDVTRWLTSVPVHDPRWRQTTIWNERRLRALLDEYVEHYTSHRPHWALQQRTPNDTDNVVPIGHDQPIRRHITCAGLINERRTAA